MWASHFPSPISTKVLSDVCTWLSSLLAAPLAGPDLPCLLFGLSCLLPKLPFVPQLFLAFSLKLLDPLPGPRICGDPGLGRSLHTLRAGTQEVDGFSFLPIHPGNGRGPDWEQEAGTWPGAGRKKSLRSQGGERQQTGSTQL